MKKGLFLTIEGCEGSGKTTACRNVIEKLTADGYEVVYTREPGGSDIAEQIRNIILDVNNTAMEARTEALLYAASRRQHLVEKVIPALEAGKIVICDRFVDSSLVYQGIARGIGVDEVYQMNRFAIADTMPDMTIYFAIEAEVGLSRIKSRDEINRLDKENLDFHKKVQHGYEGLCKQFPERIKVVDASNDPETVANDTYKLIISKVKENV